MFFGRKKEVADLKQLLTRARASLVICRGRRRIGKSTLIREFARHASKFIALEGLAPRPQMSNEHQLDAFGEQLAMMSDLPKISPTSWPQAFQLLASAIRDEPTVILLDEISWMGGYDADFPGHLKTAWDTLFATRANLVFVLCGSVSAWINDNILNNTGFVGRQSWDIVLEELSIYHCNMFWGDRRDQISALERLKILSVTGGVPRYLEEIDPSESVEENFRRLCFRKEGMLYQEFDKIFNDIFVKRATDYKNIVRALVPKAQSISEIGKTLGKARSGHLTRAIEDLTISGFVTPDISFDPQTGTPRRSQKYRLSDNYCRFYLRYVEPHRNQIEQGLYQVGPAEDLAAWDTILGLQFENLVLSNIQTLKRILRLGDTHVLSASPYYQRKTQRKEACQIDLMLRTKHSIYVVEVKMRKHLTKSVIDEVKEKVARLKIGPQLSVRTALVYAGQIDDNVAREQYFDFIIPFSELLTTEPPM